jgi:hypothetical protein
MENIDFGPAWFWRLVGIMAAVGFVAAIIWAIKGIIWLFNHVRFE